MLRVTVEYADTHTTLKVEGSLKGPWVDELKRCWVTLTSTAPRQPMCVDLTAVGFIAPEGKLLIGEMADAGVELTAAGPMIREIVDEVRAQSSHTSRHRLG